MFELENPNKDEMIEHIYRIADEYVQKSIDDPNGELAYQETGLDAEQQLTDANLEGTVLPPNIEQVKSTL